MDYVPVPFILDVTNCLHWLKAIWCCAIVLFCFFSNFAAIPHCYSKWFLSVRLPSAVICRNKFTYMLRVCRCDVVNNILFLWSKSICWLNAHVCAGFVCLIVVDSCFILLTATESMKTLHLLSIQVYAFINIQREPTEDSSSCQYLNLSLLSEWFL